jgi:hypothetical protein
VITHHLHRIGVEGASLEYAVLVQVDIVYTRLDVIREDAGKPTVAEQLI